MLVYLRYNSILVHYLCNGIEGQIAILIILHLQLIVSKVQIEIPPQLLQEEENEMVRLNLKC